MVDDIPKITPTDPVPAAPAGPDFVSKKINPSELSDTAKKAIAAAEARMSNPKSPVLFTSEMPSRPPLPPQPQTPLKSPTFSPAQTASPRRRRLLPILAVILGILIVVGILVAIPAYKTLQAAKSTLALVKETYTAGKNQNLPEFNAKLDASRQQLERTYQIYKILAWSKVIPFLGGYYNDGAHSFKAAIAGIEAAQILGKTLEPYADVLGFQGQGSFAGGTAEDRITKIVETLDKIIPEVDKVSDKVRIADEEIQQVKASRYPFTIKNRNIKETILTAQTFTHDALLAVTDAKPVLEILPPALGVKGERKYAVIFQNDAEIRATGGFMTAYGILRLDKGKVYQEKSDDIYNLDAKFKKKLPPPDLIKKYLPLVFYWNLRDMNISPDFKQSMDTFYSYYREIPGESKINGIVAVDTQVLSDLLGVLGPIDVPGYGTFSNEIDPECNCPQIIYQLELLADKPLATLKADRKGMLAPILQTLLLKAYGSPKNLWPGLFTTVMRNISEKHVLFYMLDETEQKAIERVKVAGRIEDYDADYFHINDINFAGAKSNMFVTEEVNQEITIDNGTLTKKVTVTYKNPQPASNCNLEAGQLCLNGILRDVVRLYVPKGSQLKEALGFEEGTVETNEDLGKTVFQGFFKLSPESQAKIVFEYTVPIKVDKDYRMLIQKQPGKKKPHYTITVNQAEQQEFDLATDKEVVIKLK